MSNAWPAYSNQVGDDLSGSVVERGTDTAVDGDGAVAETLPDDL